MKKLDNLLILAHRARENGDSANAAKYYEQILLEDPNNWEAVFYSDYYAAASCIIRDIGPAANRIKRPFLSAAQIIWNSDMDNKTALLVKLDRMVKKLQDNGTKSTPYADKNW